MKSELKSCPFCGGKAEYRCLKFYHGVNLNEAFVFCTECSAAIEIMTTLTEDEAFKDLKAKWNRRTGNDN